LLVLLQRENVNVAIAILGDMDPFRAHAGLPDVPLFPFFEPGKAAGVTRNIGMCDLIELIQLSLVRFPRLFRQCDEPDSNLLSLVNRVIKLAAIKRFQIKNGFERVAAVIVILIIIIGISPVVIKAISAYFYSGDTTLVSGGYVIHDGYYYFKTGETINQNY
jgi:hypothetical protein